jgi:hypothetical protein
VQVSAERGRAPRGYNPPGPAAKARLRRTSAPTNGLFRGGFGPVQGAVLSPPRGLAAGIAAGHARRDDDQKSSSHSGRVRKGAGVSLGPVGTELSNRPTRPVVQPGGIGPGCLRTRLFAAALRHPGEAPTTSRQTPYVTHAPAEQGRSEWEGKPDAWTTRGPGQWVVPRMEGVHMSTDVALVGSVAGAAFALRYVAELVVIIWSLRADEEGRKHAIRLLQLLRGGRGRKAP